MTKVSVIVPIYNVAAYVGKCLESLRCQIFTDFEVLCINDGSTDNSQAVIDEFAQADPRFQGYQKPNGGLSDARNYGLQRAVGEYVLFVDGDDFVEPQLLEVCVRALAEHQLDLVAFDYYQYFDDRGIKEVICLPLEEGRVYSLPEHPELLCEMNNAAWNKLCRTALFREHQLEYPCGYRHQDLGTTFRLLHYCQRVGVIHQPLYDYLADRPNNITQMVDNKISHILDMVQINVDFYQKLPEYDRYMEPLKTLVMINLIQSLRKAVNLKDKQFVDTFIDACFDLMKKAFPDFPHFAITPVQASSDRVYLNRNLIKLYYRYRQIKGGHSS